MESKCHLRLAAAAGRLTRPDQLALLFGSQCVLAVLLLAILVPPFQNSDEFNHADRADQVSYGGLLARRYGGPETSGGKVDPGIDGVDNIIGTVRFHPDRKVSGTMLQAADAIRWSGRVNMTFANTAIYSPLLYLPSVPGLWAGKALRLSIARTLILARATSGLTCVLVASVAIAAAGPAATFLFVVLSLPMSLSLFGALSQDGPMLALAALAVAMAGRAQEAGRDGRTHYWIMCGCLALLGVGRPAYACLCILPGVLPHISLRRRILGILVPALATILWFSLASIATAINSDASRGVDPGLQLQALLQHPNQLWVLLGSILHGPQGMEGASFWDEMIGILGWIDVVLPSWFYAFSAFVLPAAMLTALSRAKPLLPSPAQGIMFVAGLAALAAIFLLSYIGWTPVGLPAVQGVQGRYFLPIVLFIPCMLPAVQSAWLTPICQAVRQGSMLYPTISIVVTVSSVVQRYYM